MSYQDYENDKTVDFSVLKGKTIESIEKLELGSEQAFINCTDGTQFKMTYYHDCCASCSIEDIGGDLSDVIGSEVLMAEEVSSSEPDEALIEERKAKYMKELSEWKPAYSGDTFYYYGATPDNGWKEESETWTYYKLATIKGSLTIRWYGSSNGYYSESATFEQINYKSDLTVPKARS